MTPSEPTATVPLSVVLADSQLREAFVGLCRAGRVRAEGRRIRYHGTLTAEGHWKVTTSVENEYKPIPPEDWRDLMFLGCDGELRLEGARKWLNPAPAFEPKGWAFIRISERDLIDLIEDAQWRREALQTAALHGTAPASPHPETPGRGGRPGRKLGSGSKDDDAALREMLRLLASGQAHSVYDATGKVAISAGKSHSRDADRARLRRKFRNLHGTEPSAGKTWRDVADELNIN
jgi:hypothetical protein